MNTRPRYRIGQEVVLKADSKPTKYIIEGISTFENATSFKISYILENIVHFFSEDELNIAPMKGYVTGYLNTMGDKYRFLEIIELNEYPSWIKGKLFIIESDDIRKDGNLLYKKYSCDTEYITDEQVKELKNLGIVSAPNKDGN